MNHTDRRSARIAEGPSWDALDRAHRRLDQVQEWGQVGFWDVDLRSEELYWSTQVFELLGLGEPSVHEFLARVPEDDRPLLLQVGHRARQQAGPYRIEHRFRRDGDVRVLSHRIQSVAGVHGAPERLLGVITDVSQVRALESELEASIAVRNVGLAASSLVHDFKNQLAIVLGHCKLALDAVDDGRTPMRESLEAIQRAATQGVDLTRQVLDLGRGQVSAARPTDATPVLERVAALTRPIVGRGSVVAVAADPADGAVLADADRLEHVLVDLVVNAADAIGPGGGHIVLDYAEVEVGDESDGLVPGRYGSFRVSDDGEGMDEATRRRAAEPFFTTKPRGEGSGVGLLTVDAFARASGGAMRIVSEPGVGTAVEILLPLAPRRRPAAAPVVRVVVLLDDETDRKRLIDHLRDDGIQAVVADDWRDVDRYLETEPIDAVAAGDEHLDGATVAVPIVVVAAGREADVPAAVRACVPLRR